MDVLQLPTSCHVTSLLVTKKSFYCLKVTIVLSLYLSTLFSYIKVHINNIFFYKKYILFANCFENSFMKTVNFIIKKIKRFILFIYFSLWNSIFKRKSRMDEKLNTQTENSRGWSKSWDAILILWNSYLYNLFRMKLYCDTGRSFT